MTFDAKFTNWWFFYPRKYGRGAAKRSFKVALKKVDYETLLNSTREYSEIVAQWPVDQQQYVPHPSTWLNQERWDDDRQEWKRFIGASNADKRRQSKINASPGQQLREDGSGRAPDHGKL